MLVILGHGESHGSHRPASGKTGTVTLSSDASHSISRPCLTIPYSDAGHTRVRRESGGITIGIGQDGRSHGLSRELMYLRLRLTTEDWRLS